MSSWEGSVIQEGLYVLKKQNDVLEFCKDMAESKSDFWVSSDGHYVRLQETKGHKERPWEINNIRQHHQSPCH